MYLEQRLISVMSAAEGYHRVVHDDPPLVPERHAELTAAMLERCAPEERQIFRSRLEHANSQSQRQRLRGLFARASETVTALGTRQKRWVDELVDTRNYQIHLDGRTPLVLDGVDLVRAIERLVAVLNVNLLLDLGIDAEAVGRIIRRSYEGSNLDLGRPVQEQA
jgi:hypothetical protein